jgi:hypothetical protein
LSPGSGEGVVVIDIEPELARSALEKMKQFPKEKIQFAKR